MTAHDHMRAMLNELMGSASNGEDRKNLLKFTDSKVCKPFLLNCCVHEIFDSSRLNIGRCRYVHDVRLRTDFEKAQLTKDYGYDLKARNELKSFLNEHNNRVKKAKQKLAEDQEAVKSQLSEQDTVVEKLKNDIEQKIAEAEQLGIDGQVEASLEAMEEVEKLTKKKVEAEFECKTALPSQLYQQQKMKVCEVCASFLGAQDDDRRLADHFGGKLHLGYLSVKEKLDVLEEQISKKPDEQRESMTRSGSDERDSSYSERHKRKRISPENRYDQKREKRRHNYRSQSRSQNYSRDYDRGLSSRQSNDQYRRHRN